MKKPSMDECMELTRQARAAWDRLLAKINEDDPNYPHRLRALARRYKMVVRQRDGRLLLFRKMPGPPFNSCILTPPQHITVKPVFTVRKGEPTRPLRVLPPR